MITGDVLVAAGCGAPPRCPTPFANTVAATELYSIPDGAWSNADEHPDRARSGAFTVGFGAETIVVGGEAAEADDALDVAEAFDADRGTWRALRPLNVGRHSGGAAVLGDRLHVAAGSDVKGGGERAGPRIARSWTPAGPAPFVDADGGRAVRRGRDRDSVPIRRSPTPTATG